MREAATGEKLRTVLLLRCIMFFKFSNKGEVAADGRRK
uniref:Uncharacterized protein n=1 Tax=Nelumbo nucifera TaxID=4432 RepID=A0A822YXF8_NELNU|nr:TPA_asm: hypothetical protein HUJ06_006495 [Nelumbo nucifera]